MNDVTSSDWQQKILDRGELYRVGGVVREQLLGITRGVQDTDFLVRGISPDDLENILGKLGKLVLVGKSFGVYKFTPSGSQSVFDIVFPRRERSFGPGHREFEVDWDWHMDVTEDLGRRDFTINAIAQDVRTGRLIDPVGGIEDLKTHTLRMVFPQAFSEDPLRILRGLRFQTRFGLEVEEKTREAMTASVSLLSTLSAERVQEEMTKLLTQCNRPSNAFQIMHEIGALRVVLPELDRCAGVSQNEYHPDDVFTHSIRTCDVVPTDNLPVRWAALLHDVGKVDRKRTVADQKLGERVVFYGHQAVSAQAAVKILRRLRYRNALVKKCEVLVAHHMFDYDSEWKDSTVRRFIRRVGKENLEDLFVLREADVKSRDPKAPMKDLREIRERVARELRERHTIGIAELRVDGHDVIHICGVKAGPVVGEILSDLLEIVIEKPEMNDRSRLLEWLKER